MSTETKLNPIERTEAIVQAEMQKLFDVKGAKDWKAISKLSSELAKIAAGMEQAERDVKLAALAGLTDKVKKAIDTVVQRFIESKVLDIADGVWYSYDFGEKLTACKLSKATPKAKRGEGAGSGSYVSRPEKTADLLAQVGSHVMFKEATKVTIDKAERTMTAGTTFKQAFEASNNGGWRNRVRMALLKEAGLI